jgi:GR25 family glycosyltransferase involved in LPS biosynthesis/glycosyltransferase involved in cell wall biosynthesis
MNLVITDSFIKNKGRPTVCLNMIVKNEANVIVATLTNLTQYISFDYWVISDTGSTDNTQQIIQDFFLEKGIPGELFSHEWRDFGYNRSKALECAYDKTDYLFIFDADDRILGDFKLPFDGKSTYADRYMLKFGKGFEYVRPLLMNNHKRWMFKGVLHEFLANMEPVNADITVQGDYHIESGRTGNRSQNPTKYYDDAIILQNAYYKELALPDKGLADRYAFYCARSYKDAGEKYRANAIEWYKTVLEKHNNWAQEKYYSALEIGLIYKDLNQMELAVPYFLKTVEYDMDRIEGLIIAIEHFYLTHQYIVVNALYHKFKHYNRQLVDKLFINMSFYQDRLEFFNGLSAHFVGDKLSGYHCCKQVLIHRSMGMSEWVAILNNTLCYREILEKDKDSLLLFRAVDDLLCKHNELAHNKTVVELWQLLFTQNRATFTAPNQVVHKMLSNAPSSPSPSTSTSAAKIMITFTTCKRLDLFKETMQSILNHWTDIARITTWFCVDDNSSKEDRQTMKAAYPWIEYYLKTPAEKGHRASMNIIWNKLNALKPTYWLHMEDDFLFYHPMDYITQAIAVLANNTQNIKQVVFNLNYAEIIDHYQAKGHLPIPDKPHLVLHDYRPNEFNQPYMNTHYWPHYSFRPAMTLTQAVLHLGNYDSANQFFESDYALKWNEAGYKTAFFNRITHRHIGRLTSEINTGTVKNAYELNQEEQFVAVKQTNVKVINLERRTDRKLAISNVFKSAHFNEFIFSKAVDGKTLESTNELKQLFAGNDFGSRRGFIGCALSHLRLWQELAQDEKNSYYVIFEDDVSLASKTFKDHFTALTPDFEKNDVLFLGYSMYSDKRTQFKHIYDELTAESVLTIKPLNTDLYIGGFYGYSINKVGAQKLLAYIAQNGIKHGIDYLVKIVPDLKPVEIQPFLVYSEWYEDRNKPIDTDIQANYDSIDLSQTLEDMFVFHPQLDQIGNDLYYHRASMAECMLKALKDPACVGFNTLGFFKNKIETLTSSQYFGAKDGIFVKKPAKVEPVKPEPVKPEPLVIELSNSGPVKPSVVRLKMLCNWCSSAQLCLEWSNMPTGDKLVMTSTEDPSAIDYYVIINSPPPGASYVPAKTLVFQMEPWIADPAKPWGVKTWGDWAKPDPQHFFKVFSHATHLNNVQWQIDYPFHTTPVVSGEAKINRVAVICSQKNFDTGHLLRNNFLKSIDLPVDIWGRENYHQLPNYKGEVPQENKYNVYANYKYCFAAENNSEKNYATEKIWEAILCESLCFYWGCPNLEDYLDEKAFVRLPLEDPTAAARILQQALAEDWWSQRIEAIKQMKTKILNKLGFFPMLTTLLSKK